MDVTDYIMTVTVSWCMVGTHPELFTIMDACAMSLERLKTMNDHGFAAAQCWNIEPFYILGHRVWSKPALCAVAFPFVTCHRSGSHRSSSEGHPRSGCGDPHRRCASCRECKSACERLPHCCGYPGTPALPDDQGHFETWARTNSRLGFGRLADGASVPGEVCAQQEIVKLHNHFALLQFCCSVLTWLRCCRF